MQLTRSFSVALAALAALGAQAMSPATSASQSIPAAMSAIRQADIRRDMNALGGDEMRGREAGTLDEMRASMWIAEQMRKIGLTPHGDAGSWFQWFNMRRTRISTTASSIQSGGRTLARDRNFDRGPSNIRRDR